MLDDSFKDLTDNLKKVLAGQPVDMQEVMRKSMSFVDELKTQLRQASEEERFVIMEKLQGMYETIGELSRAISQRTSLSEEQMTEFTQNKENFTPAQWEALQAAKEKFEEGKEEIIHSIIDNASPAAGGSKGNNSQGIRSQGRRRSRQEWIKS